MKTDQKTFFGTVESCQIDEKVIVLRFICEKIRDDFSGKEDRMPYDRMPMASIIKVIQVSFDSLDALRSLRKDDKLSVSTIKWQDSSITYEVANLTLQQKYQDPAVYVGTEANRLLSSEPHSINERLIPATLPAGETAE